MSLACQSQPASTVLPLASLQHDGVNRGQVEQLVDTFPGQSIDFFGALRARVYDEKVKRATCGPDNASPWLALCSHAALEGLALCCHLLKRPWLPPTVRLPPSLTTGARLDHGDGG